MQARVINARHAPFALVTALVLATVQPAHAAGPEVVLEVKRDGLKWTGPCRADFYSLSASADPDEVAASLGDVAEPIGLAAGRYHAVVSCPSTEGDLRTTVPLRVGKSRTKKKLTLKPGFVVVNVTRGGKEVPADITITDRYGRRIQEGRDRVAHPVPAGKLLVRARVDKKAAKRRKPVVGEASINVRVGKKATPVIDTSDGKVLVTLLQNGKPAEGIASFRIPGEADRLVEVPAGETAEIPPGTFDMLTQLSAAHDYHEVKKRAVTIKPGKLTKVKANHAVGTFKAKLSLESKAIDDSTPVELDLYLGEAPEPFNTLDRDDEGVLKPGKYRVRARLADKKYDDKTPWASEARFSIKARRPTAVKLDLSAAKVDVKATMGKKPRRLLVEVLRPDAKEASAKKRTKKDGSASFALGPGKYRVRATVVTPQGDYFTEKNVTLKRGKTKTVKLDVDVGTATVQVFDKGVAVPARVKFFEAGAAAPVATVRAGRKVFLPPGRYSLSVHHKGQRYTYSDIKVAAGRDAERSVELHEAASTTVDSGGDEEPAPNGAMPEGD